MLFRSAVSADPRLESSPSRGLRLEGGGRADDTTAGMSQSGNSARRPGFEAYSIGTEG